MRKLKVTVPVYYLPYLINDDPDGLQGDEITQINGLLSAYGPSARILCPDGEPYFSHKNDVNHLGGDVVDCTLTY